MESHWEPSGEIVWRPTPEQAAGSRRAAFLSVEPLAGRIKKSVSTV